jgi:hypothetical protein
MGHNEDPQSLHKYAYGHCDPVNMVDPGGQSALYVAIAIVVVLIVLAIAVYYLGSLYSQARTHRATIYTPPGPSTVTNPFAGMSGPFKIKIAANESHSWIDVTHIASGERHTFGRYGTGYGNPPVEWGGVRVDKEINPEEHANASRTRTINTFKVTIDKGYDEWWNNCSAFARKTWEDNTGEDIDTDTWIGIDTPGICTDSIRKANNGKDHYEITPE